MLSLMFYILSGDRICGKERIKGRILTDVGATEKQTGVSDS